MPVLFHSDRSIDWPLRNQKISRTILLSPFTDWMRRKYPITWQRLILATMSLATWHTFITFTHEYANLVSMLGQVEGVGKDRMIPVPSDAPYLKAILRANLNRGKYNLSDALQIRADADHAQNPPRHTLSPFQERVGVPWPPRNVLFGLSVGSPRDADTVMPLVYNMRKQWPGMKIGILQEVVSGEIDWEKVGGSVIKNCVDYLWTDGQVGAIDTTGSLV